MATGKLSEEKKRKEKRREEKRREEIWQLKRVNYTAQFGKRVTNCVCVKVDINEPWKMCYEEALKSRHSEPKAKNLTKKQILRSAYGLPQDDGEDKGAKCQKKRRMSTEESVYFCALSDAK